VNVDPKLIGDPVRIEGLTAATRRRTSDFARRVEEADESFTRGAARRVAFRDLFERNADSFLVPPHKAAERPVSVRYYR
jgi:hypothetical protein